MKVLVQRSAKAFCKVDDEITGKIDSGLVLLVGFTEGDDLEKIKFLAKKVVNLRIFPDEEGVMNKSILEVGGKILSISQFTLYADCKKGNRPSYINALNNKDAINLYNDFNKELRNYIEVEEGVFGADMEITLTNVGPTTIILEK